MSVVAWLLGIVAALITYPIAAGAWGILMLALTTAGVPFAATGLIISPFVGAVAALAVGSKVVRR